MPLKIMTYNVDMRSSKNARIPERISALATYIQFEKPDIICFQEFGSIAHPSLALLIMQGPTYKHFIGDRDLVTLISNQITIHSVNNIKFAFDPRGGIPIFTKGTMIGKGFALFTLMKEDFVNSDPFSLINTHLDPHLKNHENRLKEFRKMASFQDNSGCTVKIMVGDFNEPNGESLARPCGYLYDRTEMVTHHHTDNVRRKSKNEALRKDWVMVKNASFVKDSISTYRLKFGSGACGGEDVSDHSPVMTTLI